jgi:signal transduction histidine kinase
VAHDFNNLLTVINGYSQVLLSRLPTGDNMRRGVEEISKAGTRGADLTRQLLIYARHEETGLEPLDLNVVVSDLSSLLESIAGTRVRLTMKLNEPLGLVRSDRGQINRLLMNLVANARDAMPAGGSITVETEIAAFDTGQRTGRFVVVTVSDTGVGMDEATKSRIFEPFFTTKRPEIGTGLGLPIVQAVAISSGGWVDVESAPGQGSTFRVYLPLVAENVNGAPGAPS